MNGDSRNMIADKHVIIFNGPISGREVNGMVLEEETVEKQKVVLVVEDNEPLNELICLMLGDKGYKTLNAFRGDEALKLMKENMPDIVLMDFVLPDVDGVELFKRIYKEESIRGIPVIVVSARGDLQTKLASYSAGARRYVTKPFDNDDLIAEVEKTLRQLELSKKVKDYKDECGNGGDFGVIPKGFEEGKEGC